MTERDEALHKKAPGCWSGCEGECGDQAAHPFHNRMLTALMEQRLQPAQEALARMLLSIPHSADWHAHRYDTDDSMKLILWRGDQTLEYSCARGPSAAEAEVARLTALQQSDEEDLRRYASDNFALKAEVARLTPPPAPLKSHMACVYFSNEAPDADDEDTTVYLAADVDRLVARLTQARDTRLTEDDCVRLAEIQAFIDEETKALPLAHCDGGVLAAHMLLGIIAKLRRGVGAAEGALGPLPPVMQPLIHRWNGEGGMFGRHDAARELQDFLREAGPLPSPQED